MLRLSKKSDYALISMKHLAMRPDGGARPAPARFPSPTTSRSSCWRRCCSAWCARGCWCRCRARAAAIGSAGSAATISVADVIQAVDGPVTVTACSDDDHNCDQYTKCSIRDPLWKIKNRILDALNTVSVAEMAAESDAPAPVPTHTVSRMMFVPPIGEN